MREERGRGLFHLSLLFSAQLRCAIRCKVEDHAVTCHAHVVHTRETLLRTFFGWEHIKDQKVIEITFSGCPRCPGPVVCHRLESIGQLPTRGRVQLPRVEAWRYLSTASEGTTDLASACLGCHIRAWHLETGAKKKRQICGSFPCEVGVRMLTVKRYGQ